MDMSYCKCVVSPGMEGVKTKKGQRGAGVAHAMESFYLIVVTAYVTKAFLETTLFYVPWPENTEKLFRTLICGIIFLKLAVSETLIPQKLLGCAFTLVVFKLSWAQTGYAFLLDTALLALGAINVSYKKILKTGFWTGTLLLLVTMLGSFAGCISDLVYFDGGMFKHSFGGAYTTDFAAHVAFLFLTGWVLYGRQVGLPFVAGALGLCAFLYCYTGAKCSAIVLLLSAAGIMYVFLTEHRKCRRIDRFLIYMLPLCGLIMIFLTLCYAPENAIMSKLDWMLSTRLRLGKAVMDKYGFTFFGTPFPQQGFGGTTAWTWTLEYTFVDCSYVLVLVRYGMATLLAFCAGYIYIGRKTLRQGNRRLLMAMALVAIHSMIEHHLPEVAYNLFLLLPFTDCSDGEETSQEKAPTATKPFRLMSVSCLCVAVAVVLPRFISYLATLVDLWQLALRENHLKFLFIASGCIVWLTLLELVLFKTAAALVRRKLPPTAIMIGLAALPLTFGVAFLKTESVIREGRDEWQRLVASDRPIVEELLQKGSSTKLYVDHFPEIYKREFHRVSDKVIAAEGLAVKKDTTLIAEDGEELWILMAAGYEYGELASGHAVYTNSDEHKSLLEDAGIAVEDYYYKKRNWNLQALAGWNGLKLDDAGGILLSGQANSLLHGPGITVYGGVFRVEFKIRLITPPPIGSVVATSKISSDWGLHLWGQRDLLLTDFDEWGNCVFAIDCNFSMFNSSGVEFTLLLPDGVELELLGVSYGKEDS